MITFWWTTTQVPLIILTRVRTRGKRILQPSNKVHQKMTRHKKVNNLMWAKYRREKLKPILKLTSNISINYKIVLIARLVMTLAIFYLQKINWLYHLKRCRGSQGKRTRLHPTFQIQQDQMQRTQRQLISRRLRPK